MARETRNGKTLESRVWALIEDAANAANAAPAVVVQGSWSNADASAGTHSGGGAFDLRSRDYSTEQALALVDALRRRNVCAWWRTPQYGWPSSAGGPHIHGIVRDEPGLSPSAADQVNDYDRGRNGLASDAPDPFPRPPQAPFPLAEDPDMAPLIIVRDTTTGAYWTGDFITRRHIESMAELEALGVYAQTAGVRTVNMDYGADPTFLGEIRTDER